jgi:hypothetical protein
MKNALVRGLFVVAALIVAWTGVSDAAFTTYTMQGIFMTDIAHLEKETLDFEDFSPGHMIPSGAKVDGITFTYDIFGETAMVVDSFHTIQGYNALGLTGGDDAFWDGDEMHLDFESPISAFGIFFITSDLAADNEIQVTTPQGTAYNQEGDYNLLDDGGLAYFVGMRSSELFSSTDIGFLDDGQSNFLYTMDYIITGAPVPAPPALLLLGSGLGFLGTGALWRRRQGRDT